MDIRNMIDGLLEAAKAATAIIPGTTDDAVVGAAGKIRDLLGDLMDKAPDDRTQAEMQSQRHELSEAVKAKANRLADRLDG